MGFIVIIRKHIVLRRECSLKRNKAYSDPAWKRDKIKQMCGRGPAKSQFLNPDISKLQSVCSFYWTVKCCLHFTLLKIKSHNWLITGKLGRGTHSWQINHQQLHTEIYRSSYISLQLVSSTERYHPGHKNFSDSLKEVTESQYLKT